ncbi:MAG: hypothetical protein ACSHYA_18550 [Opitutaceae bacterium]
MSQHIFEQNVDSTRYYVQMGWDKPCQIYYGIVFEWIEDPLERNGGYWNENDPVWSSVSSSEKSSLIEITHIIESLGLVIPQPLIKNVLHDRFRNSVNELTTYDKHAKEFSIETHGCER